MTKQNEVHVKLISKLREENTLLRLYIKAMEDLHKTISTTQRDQHTRHALLKAQARKLNYKPPTSSTRSKEAASTTLPASQ